MKTSFDNTIKKKQFTTTKESFSSLPFYEAGTRFFVLASILQFNR